MSFMALWNCCMMMRGEVKSFAGVTIRRFEGAAYKMRMGAKEIGLWIAVFS